MPALVEVLLPKKKRSNYNLSQVRRFSMAPGLGYPVLVEEVLPNDVFTVDTESLVKTYPLLAPLLGSFELRFDFFFCPTRLYQQEMDTNRVMFKPQNTNFPFAKVPVVYSSTASTYNITHGDMVYPGNCVKKSSLLEHLGLAAGSCNVVPEGSGADHIYMNVVPLVAYYDIFRNYYANTQEGFMYVARRGSKSTPGATSALGFQRVALSQIDALIQACLSTPGIDLSDWKTSGLGGDWKPVPYSYSDDQDGLWTCSYRSDMLTAYLSQATYTDMVTSSSINVENNQVTVNQIRFASHLMEYFERGLVAGGRYDDWVEAQYGVKCNRDLCIPEFLGRIKSSVVFQDVVSTSNSKAGDAGESVETGLGDLGGRGHGYVHGRKIRFSAEENGYFMCIATLVPKVSYCQGVAPYMLKTDLMELHSPQLERIGFQTLPEAYATMIGEFRKTTDQSGTSTFTFTPSNRTKSGYGYQPAWTEYRTALDRNVGDFGELGDLNYWVINRRFTTSYQWSSSSQEIVVDSSDNFSSYIFPSHFSYPFADQSVDAENFLVQVAFDIKAGRPVGKQVMPTL